MHYLACYLLRIHEIVTDLFPTVYRAVEVVCFGPLQIFNKQRFKSWSYIRQQSDLVAMISTTEGFIDGHQRHLKDTGVFVD